MSAASRESTRARRLHIGLFGRRNAGKSSLCNALCGQDAALVSSVPGTTTDPVEKVMEMAPLGPVVLWDTPGLDDTGELGSLRVARTLRTMREVDVALLVLTDTCWEAPEQEALASLRAARVPLAVICNCRDRQTLHRAAGWRPAGLPSDIPLAACQAVSGDGLDNVRDLLRQLAPQDSEPSLLEGLLPDHGGTLVLVCPQDSGAPRGRLIMPQVQAIRDGLDGGTLCLVCTDSRYAAALSSLRDAPQLVVCDSQVIHSVAAQTPDSLPLTTFSVLMARLKGDLALLARGAGALTRLRPGQTVIMQEACSHHPQEDDIGRVKIPRLLSRMAGGPLHCPMLSGRHWSGYEGEAAAIVHCGGCTLRRRQMQARLLEAQDSGVPMTNYGMAISLAQGVLERVLSPFPHALAAFREARS